MLPFTKYNALHSCNWMMIVLGTEWSTRLVLCGPSFRHILSSLTSVSAFHRFECHVEELVR